MLVRVLIAALAVAALAWLALGLRSLALTERADRIAAGPASPAQLDEAVDALDDARFLNPDTRPQLLKGALLARAGGDRAREGLALIEAAVADEPENLIAWGVLADATSELAPARSRAARERMAELSPPVPRQ